MPLGIDISVYILLGIIIVIVASSVKIIREYKRAVIFRLGRLLGIKGPVLIVEKKP